MQGLQELVSRIVLKSEEAGLYLNVEKTKVIKSETDCPSGENLVINGGTVEKINHFTYLGAMITNTYDDSKEIRKGITTYLMNLKALKLLNHSKGKLKDGMITATAGYVENSLARSGS